MDLEGIGQLRGLKELKLTNDLTDGKLHHLAQLTKLEKLSISFHNPRIGSEMKYLAELKNLRELDFSNTRITDEGLRELVPLKELKRLNLISSAVTNEGMKILATFPELESLGLGLTSVNEVGLAELAACKKLQRRFGQVHLEGADQTRPHLYSPAVCGGVRRIEEGASRLQDHWALTPFVMIYLREWHSGNEPIIGVCRQCAVSLSLDLRTSPFQLTPRLLYFFYNLTRRGAARLARQAHNLEVVGSNPTAAT